MSNDRELVGPVGIGGVGGSGTRVIASMVSSLGFHPGADLNTPEDDLTFSMLFKRPRHYRGVRGLVPADHPSAVAATRAFIELRHRRRTPTSVTTLLSACAEFPRSGVTPLPNKPWTWAMGRLTGALRNTAPPEAGMWTWKEPNTLLFIPTLFREIDGLRYIHVVRNGLSMAKSKNRYQLGNWGSLFGVDADDRPVELRQLIYWARVNLAVSDFLGSQPRSLVVTHERAVADPMGVLNDIAAFLGREVTDEGRAVVDRVRRPDDFARSYPFDESDMDTQERADVRRALERFGYVIDGDPR